MATASSPTSRFLHDQADELISIGSVLTKAADEVEWTCAKADRFREAMQGRILQIAAASMSMRGLADRVDRTVAD